MRSTNSNNNSHRQHSSYSSSSSSSSSSSQQAHSSYSSGGGSSNVGSSSQSFVMTMATDTLVLRGSIPPGYTYDGMRDIVKVYGPVESVRIIRDRLTGESKGYSFAIFATAREAHNFLAATGGCLRLPDGETSLTMEYVRSEPRHKSMPGSSHTSETSSTTTTNTTQKSHYGYQPHPKRTNWICPVCKIDNFARRDVCYKCNFPRPTQPDTEQGSSKDKDKDKHTTSNSNEKAQPTSTQPMQSENEEKSIYDDSVTYTTTICVRGLSSETDERALVRFFSHIAPVKAIRLARDKDSGYSRGFCHIEFYCIDDADGAVKMTNCTVIEKDGFPVKVALAASGSPTSRPSEECLGVPSGTLAFRYTGGPVQLIDTEGNFVYGNSFANTTATTDQAALEAWINYANDLKKYIEASQETQTSETTATTTATENKEIAENKGTEEKNAKESTTSAADITDNNGNEIKESEEDIDASLDEFFKDLNGTVENISTISAAPVKNETQVTDTNTATTVTATTTTTNNNNNDNDNNNSNSTDNSNCETSLNTDRTEGENEINFESTVDPIGHLIPDTVCILCMRQLPSVEALQRHIELSRLHKYHKERLEQERKLKQKPCSSALDAIEQEERLGERGALYRYLDIKYPEKKRQRRNGPDYDKMATEMIKAQLKARAEEQQQEDTTVSVDKEISENNIGSKMLRKMGWSHGEGLGKGSDGIKAPIALVSYDSHAGVGSSVGVQINPGDTYKERARKYAMMLYEESRKKTELELNADPNYNGISKN